MRSIRKFIIPALFILLVVLPSVIVLLSIEKEPFVTETAIINTESAIRAKALAKRSLAKLLNQKNTSSTISISTSEDELNSLIALMARGISRLEGHIQVSPDGLDAAITLRLPNNPIGNYINLRATVIPSESGLHFSEIRIGRIKLSDNMSLFILRLIPDLILGNGNGTVAVNSVRSVVFARNNVTLNLTRIHDIIGRKEKIRKRMKVFRDDMALLSDPADVRVYYAKLLEVESGLHSKNPVSLARFTGPLFELVEHRSLKNNPAEESKAALLALAIYAGDWRFERLIGEVRTSEMKSKKYKSIVTLLGGRKDLRLHFVISSGLKIVSESGITHSIGEFKELLDTRRGGSGFSFVDLAADRAGARLADILTGHKRDARKLQSMLAGNTNETMFFPKVNDLPEDLTQFEFESKYINVGDEKYNSVVNKIDERISNLPAYLHE